MGKLEMHYVALRGEAHLPLSGQPTRAARIFLRMPRARRRHGESGDHLPCPSSLSPGDNGVRETSTVAPTDKVSSSGGGSGHGGAQDHDDGGVGQKS